MGIPSPLAFPPTALRNVAAGLVVGNPIGSGGTRAKALTAAELKAIVEASGISYLPLSGGTLTGALSLGSNALTCGNVTTGGNITASNAGGRTDAVITRSSIKIGQESGTEYGYITSDRLIGLSMRWNSTSGAGVAVAATSFVPSSNGAMTLGEPPFHWRSLHLGDASKSAYLYAGGASILQQRNGLNAQCHIVNKSYTSDVSQEALMLDAGKQISGKLGLYSYRGTSGGSNYPIQIGMLDADGSTFSGLSVDTTGTITFSGYAGNSMIGGEIYSGGRTGVLSSQLVGGRYNGIVHGYHDLNLSTGNGSYAYRDSVVISGVDQSAKFAGAITHVPQSSVSLTTNGQFSIEMTSNTAGNLVYRGSDGTTRRMALLFA